MLKPALLIIAGRIAGFVAAFVTPLILVRMFDLETFGTYKQWFLLYITLLTITQIGMSESLLFFLPKADGQAGRYVMNSVLFLTAMGTVAAALLVLNAEAIARWMSNPALEPLIPFLALYLLLMQASIGLETVMTARSAYRSAAVAYAVTDVTRVLFLIVPVLIAPSLRSLLYGAVAFAVLRFLYTAHYFWRTFRGSFRPDAVCFTQQLAYALPFALAVVASIAQENLHQYAVSGLFEAATFAVYSVGCLQIPLVDLVATTVCNVMMVGMSTAIHSGRESQVIDLWHDTVRKLAIVFFPLGALLLISRARSHRHALHRDVRCQRADIHGRRRRRLLRGNSDGWLDARVCKNQRAVGYQSGAVGDDRAPDPLVNQFVRIGGRYAGYGARVGAWKSDRVGCRRINVACRRRATASLATTVAHRRRLTDGGVTGSGRGVRPADGALPPDPCDRHRLWICVCGDGPGRRSHLAP